MDCKGKERGILKLESRPRVIIEPCRSELTPQGSCERGPSSPQPSVDRLSVTWAEPGSMTSSGVNLFHLPSETPISNEVKFSPTAGDGSEDEDYSASLSAVLRQRRASVRRSRKGRARRPSSPFLPDDSRPRRRSSVFTTSSGDTAISIEETPTAVTQEQIFENIHLHKVVLGSVKQQPLGMRRKLKIVHQARGYIKRHEGQLQERLAQSKSTRNIYARLNIYIATKWQQLKREAANTSNVLIPWEARIKEIESHFGSVVASYFTFLRWLFWVNLVIATVLLLFVIVPECLTANPDQDGERKVTIEDRNATNLLTLWQFEGVLKYSPIFYGYYSNIERPQYRMPLAYFLTGLTVYIYSFVAILRKMAENSRMSKLSEKEDECIFSWKLFTGWDFMIGNTETAHNRIASVILGFKEALLEEAEKKKDLRNWRIITLRAVVNICVVLLLAVSAFAVVHVVSHSDDDESKSNWWQENETTTVVTVISITFPVFFELLGLLEHYHPRKQLRLQLARIMLLNLLNLYSLIIALFTKIDGMSIALNQLKPNATNITALPNDTWIPGPLFENDSCVEEVVACGPCSMHIILSAIEGVRVDKTYSYPITSKPDELNIPLDYYSTEITKSHVSSSSFVAENLEQYTGNEMETTTLSATQKELQNIKNILHIFDAHSKNDSSVSSLNDDFIIFSNEIDATINDNTTNTDELTTTETTSYSAEISSTKEGYENTVTDGTITSSTLTGVTEDNTDNTLDTSTITENTTDDILDTSFTITENATDKTPDTSSITENNTNDILDTYIITENITENTLDTHSAETTVITDLNVSPNTPETIQTADTTSTINSETDSYDPTVFKETTHSYSPPQTSLYDKMTTAKDFAIERNPTGSITRYKKDVCFELSFNCTTVCEGKNITQVFSITNCTITSRVCYERRCNYKHITENMAVGNATLTDFVYEDERHNKQYNLSIPTRKKLLKLCWETMFGQELIKLTMMDLLFVLLGSLFMDFFRALFVRYMNRCWCWDLEKKFPEYGDFKIAENILHLINNQGMVWMGMFFSPGLVVLNVAKLMIMMYLRSWAVMTCNVPHEVVFRVSKSNNFYLALLLTMLFLCVLPVGYSIVLVKPSWHCGPFSEYDRIYYIMTSNIYKLLPKSLNFTLKYFASPAIVIPLLVLLILIIYYLTSLTNSLREANNDLKIQLRRERTEERRKMFQLADTRRRAGSSAIDNTPFARWKKALPSLPISKSIDSDDRKAIVGDETVEPLKTIKKKGGIFAKIVNMALDKKSDVLANSDDPSPSSYNLDDETDTDFHETLPQEILKAKDIKIPKNLKIGKKNIVEFKTDEKPTKLKQKNDNLIVNTANETSDNKAVAHELKENNTSITKSKSLKHDDIKIATNKDKIISEKQTSESSTQSRQSDSIGSVIPVIMISTTESDEDVTKFDEKRDSKTKERKHKDYVRLSRGNDDGEKKTKKNSTESKSLRRQSSVESIKD